MKNLVFPILVFGSVAIFLTREEWGCDLYILIVNGLAAFIEGMFAFGGSLVFLALTVDRLGWESSVLLDCILASINLSFVVVLKFRGYKRTEQEEAIRRCLRQYIIAIVGLGLGLWYFIIFEDSKHRVIPFVIFGILACFMKAAELRKNGRLDNLSNNRIFRKIKSALFIIPGISLGSSNQEAPLTDYISRLKGKEDRKGRGSLGSGIKEGQIALFITLILLTKATVFIIVGGSKVTTHISLLNVGGYACAMVPFTVFGDRISKFISNRTVFFRTRTDWLMEHLKIIIMSVSLIYITLIAILGNE